MPWSNGSPRKKGFFVRKGEKGGLEKESQRKVKKYKTKETPQNETVPANWKSENPGREHKRDRKINVYREGKGGKTITDRMYREMGGLSMYILSTKPSMW